MTTTKKTAKTPDDLVDVGYDINSLLRHEPEEIRVTYALLQEPGDHLSLAEHGYLKFGGDLRYRPTGFDIEQGAVIVARVH